MNTPESEATPITTTSPRRARRAGLWGLSAAVALGALGYGGYWFLDARHYESTDDAYVDGDVVQVTSEVPGTVLSLKADDTQLVSAGQPLLQLDPADAKIAVANAEADLARAVRQVRGLFAQSKELQAQIDQREQAERTADEDLKRRGGLIADGAISAEELSHARDAVTTTRANVAAARQQLDQTIAQIDGTTIADHPQVLAAAAAVRNAQLALHRTELTSPVTGIIAKRSVEVGQRVAAGTPLLAVVPLDDVWIDANFKEVQLQRMRAGQPVTVRTDLYGRERDVSRPRGRRRRRQRQRVRAAAGAKRLGQLDQDRAARPRAHSAGSAGAQGASAARRPIRPRYALTCAIPRAARS